jgi:hypothetical protein
LVELIYTKIVLKNVANIDIETLIGKLEQGLPEIFLGSKVGELTGGAVNWGTIQNRRSQRLIPNEDQIFVRSGNRILVVRDPFLAWFATTLRPARQLPSAPPPRRTRRGPPAGELDRARQ